MHWLISVWCWNYFSLLFQVFFLNKTGLFRKLAATLKRKAVYVLRKKKKFRNSFAIYFTISHSKWILLISSMQNCLKAHCVKRFSKYMFLKIEILFIPLLANSLFWGQRGGQHIQHVPWHHWRTNAFLPSCENSRRELMPSPILWRPASV
jgi:hypothetical protein